MITPKILMKLMKQYGLHKCTVTEDSMTFEMPPPVAPAPTYVEMPPKGWTPEEVAGIEEDYGPGATDPSTEEDLDNSAEMTEPADKEMEELRRKAHDGLNDIYEDGDLYPDGVDPVKASKDYRKAVGEPNVR